MGDALQKNELAQLILAVLEKSGTPLLARQVAENICKQTGIKIRRKDVNGCLYGSILKNQVVQVANYRWTLKTQTGKITIDQLGTNESIPLSDSGSPNKGVEINTQNKATLFERLDESISVESVRRDLKFSFKEGDLSGPFVFDVRNSMNQLDIRLNTAHPANQGLENLFNIPSSENGNPALRTLKLLLKAWAKLEDDAEGQRRQALEDARLDWGRIARDLIQEADD